MLKLINTIEISPFKYSKEEYEMPDISDHPDSEEWYNRWINAISTLDLDLNAIKAGECLVDMENIDGKNLQIILEVNLKDSDKDSIRAFDGGIVLTIDDEIKIAPNCCSDIGNIAEWQRIFEKETTGWSDLWIGHPWIFYKKENGKIQFSDYSDENLKDFKDIKPVFEVDEDQLKTEFQKIKKHQTNFKNKILEILKKMNFENAEKISEVIAGIK
ncbi:hypothetical protein C1637_09260 [Chryseobacterium lactis]|uniref:Uncharacterized protein n=1 Tax=Chryseobacterium lactis TaxID=1241981 RepID=A0A3G6RMB1_CHRLC|nr:hypothetical protein [Chryseobacterium lactis]AZA82288.1 hypothetical protein EG342_10445 [Chryseobacterium lactis]AZB02670.1 hypothetical protein EG341_01305 [Chryseobacterium lactis]PNW14038.1 hypothetical protein C1637_09260 [Chryseobacterium lactis]